MIVIQEIQTQWSKRSRGGLGAIARNAVPERLSFIPFADSKAVFEHSAYYSEWDGFVAHAKVSCYDAMPSVRYGCVRLDIDDNGVDVIWRYDPGYIGAPGRDGPPKRVFRVLLGEWGSVRYNGRMTEEHGWWYRKFVLNVGMFASLSGIEFTTSEPNFTYDQMARLR